MKLPIFTHSSDRLLDILREEDIKQIKLIHKVSTSDVLCLGENDNSCIGHVYYFIKTKVHTEKGRWIFAKIKIGDRRGLVKPSPNNTLGVQMYFEHMGMMIESDQMLQKILELVPGNAALSLCARDTDYNWTQMDRGTLLLDIIPV